MPPCSPTSCPHRRQRGVVVSELVLVVVVVAALLAIIVVSVRGIRSDATSADCRTQLRRIEVAAEQYKAQTGAYPADKSALVDQHLVKAADVPDYAVELGDGGSTPTFPPSSACD